VFRSLFGKTRDIEVDFGRRVIAVRTKKEAAADKGGCWSKRAKIRRLGDQSFFTGELCDSPKDTENPYKGVVFWYLLSQIEELREFASMESAIECWQAYERSSPKKEEQSGS
jgi:hypothetical protein